MLILNFETFQWVCDRVNSEVAQQQNKEESWQVLGTNNGNFQNRKYCDSAIRISYRFGGLFGAIVHSETKANVKNTSTITQQRPGSQKKDQFIFKGIQSILKIFTVL